MNKQKFKEEMYFKPLSSHELYETKIKPLLKQMSTEKLNISQVIKRLKLFESYSNIFTNERDTEFKQLKMYKQNLAPLFAKISQFVLDYEQKCKQKKIKLLIQQQNDEIIELQKQDIIYFMSLMALNLIPYQQHHKQNKYLPFSQKKKFPYPFDFGQVFSSEQFKTKTIIQYFKEHFNKDDWKRRSEKFVIKRKYLKTKVEEILKTMENKKMGSYDIRQDNESIEDFIGHVKVDFANKFIGGGALTHGCVQEEIMFATHPELFTSVLFCEVMNDHQALFFSGFRKYFKNKGYGWTTKYDGHEIIDEETFKKNQFIVAIDASHFPTNKDLSQFKKESIDREILKAYVGFHNLPEKTDIVTGNWGCGAFNGDVRLKFLIQWMACSLVQKHMIYCPFGHRQQILKNQSILKQLEETTVGEVYRSIIKGGEKMKKFNENIFQKIAEQLMV